MGNLSGVGETVNRIKQMGLIAVVRGDFPVQDLLEIGDALLAVPLLVMEITLDGPEAVTAVSELRQRFGQHMVIGAGNIQTARQAKAAVVAGAQFIASHGFGAALQTQAQASALLYLPTIGTAHEAREAWQAGCRMVKVGPSAVSDSTVMEHIRLALPRLTVVWATGVALANIGAYARMGAAAVCVDEALGVDTEWSQAALITQARKLRAAWEDAKNKRPYF